MTVNLQAGGQAVVATRRLADGLGEVAVLQRFEPLTANWWRMFGHHAISLSAIGLVLAGMATAYILQTQRAQAADEVCDRSTRRSRTPASSATRPAPVKSDCRPTATADRRHYDAAVRASPTLGWFGGSRPFALQRRDGLAALTRPAPASTRGPFAGRPGGASE